MINPIISAVWSTTKPIPPFSCTPRVQQVLVITRARVPYGKYWHSIVVMYGPRAVGPRDLRSYCANISRKAREEHV